MHELYAPHPVAGDVSAPAAIKFSPLIISFPNFFIGYPAVPACARRPAPYVRRATKA
ncbi:hypothetical protein AGR7A_Lc20047 [Agrobacterium deltaense NCPPB 1641]|uniref:Uncharacterized protein n=1 Tax=Agrobacterium deltaense NCPPB 1641 TaxID=1183425 RepID=A0A1S7U5B8_9HYPH|nr:hypothetical protein AGR7A_Lc20047 [Agrobacterium deltaense NCPPB 1641]